MRGREKRSDTKEAVLFRIKLHTGVLTVIFLTCFVFGARMYPTFRMRVRHQYLAPIVPWASGLFEAKEHFTTIATDTVLALALLSWSLSESLAEQTSLLVMAVGVRLKVPGR